MHAELPARRSLVPALLLAAALLPPLAPSQIVWTKQHNFNVAYTALAYDEARDRAVLFSGQSLGATTWEWDGTSWAQRTPQNSPDARLLHAMAYDARRQRTVLFGGRGSLYSGPVFGDTWEWDGTNWHRREVQTSPRPRAGHAMVYDAARACVVLNEGGFTWEWNGTRWLLREAAGPSALYHAMAYDKRRGQTVLFTQDGETWEWDGISWALRAPSTSPWGRIHSAMAYDEARGVCVLFGGNAPCDPYDMSDTWEWDGSNWALRDAPCGANCGLCPGMHAHAMVYDSARQRILRVGLVGCSRLLGCVTLTSFAGTWEYRALNPASWARLGSGCAGTAGIAALTQVAGSLPWAGSVFELDLSPLPSAMPAAPIGILGISSAVWGPFALPLDLGVIGAPGCAIHTSVEASFPLAPSGSRATWSIPLPGVPSLLGLPFFAQALVFDPPANPAGLVVSDAGRAVIGGR